MNDVSANIAAGASASSFVAAFFVQANAVLQFIALAVSIVAGIYAIRHYRRYKG